MTISLVPSTSETIDDQLLDFVNQSCNQAYTTATAPSGVNLFITQAKAYFANTPGLESKRLGDASFSFSKDLPPAIQSLLRPYKVVRFV